ncbi:lysozyme-like protein [Rhizobium phage RHph_X2_24]|nr:lysozyme-like protein [Rhizobium phage RHph_X2_24]
MDKYYVYRPMLDLIGHTEGTDKGDGYNETLAYGKYTGGNVSLVTMTLDQVDALQTKMLQHPDNKLNSSACGRYQIVRTTLRQIREQLNLAGSELFDADMQDRLGCYLLGVRGIDKYLAGRLKEDTLINNLAKEWASLPTTKGVGYYGGQHAAVGVLAVRERLAECRTRHSEGLPKIPIPVDRPVVPEKVEQEVRQKTNWGAFLSTIFGGVTAFATWAMNAEPQLVLVIVGTGVVTAGALLIGGEWIVRRIRSIKQELEA